MAPKTIPSWRDRPKEGIIDRITPDRERRKQRRKDRKEGDRFSLGSGLVAGLIKPSITVEFGRRKDRQKIGPRRQGRRKGDRQSLAQFPGWQSGFRLDPRDRQQIVPRPRRRRRPKQDPDEVVKDFRRRFPNIPVPDPGPEPQPLEGKLEPDPIERAGVVWAIRTAEGLARKFAPGDEKAQEKLIANVVPALLDSREVWEKRTTAGIKRFLQDILEEEGL